MVISDVEKMKNTKTLQLTKTQTLLHYSSVLILLFIAVVLKIPPQRQIYTGITVSDFLTNHFGVFFVLPAIALFYILKRQLRFNTIDISVNKVAFKKSVAEAVKELEWEINEERDDIVIAKSSLFKNIWCERVSIIWCDNQILFNSICDPDTWLLSVLSPMNKYNRRVFEQCLRRNAGKSEA